MFVLCEILTERNESASANGLKRIQSVNTVTAGGSSTSHRQTDRLELNVTFWKIHLVFDALSYFYKNLICVTNVLINGVSLNYLLQYYLLFQPKVPNKST